jgi:hypothetical protein
MQRRTRQQRLKLAPRREREGAVMLVVLLILLTATTLAATSLQTTQFELRSSGYNRAAMQTEYVSEAAASTTLAWIDATTMDRSFLRHLQAWNAQLTAPSMGLFGEPDVRPDNRSNANRTQWIQQRLLTTNITLPPITQAGYTQGNFVDPIGTFGPRSPYVPGAQEGANSPTDYVVDLYDCRPLSNTGATGYQVNQGGSGSLRFFQYYCVVTSRGRAYVPFPGGNAPAPTKTWTIPNGGANGAYVVNRFTMAHDSRGAIITPPMSQ